MPSHSCRFITELEPGMFVRHPRQPDWGLGQVQSVAQARITVNFEHAGKIVINAEHVDLLPSAPDAGDIAG